MEHTHKSAMATTKWIRPLMILEERAYILVSRSSVLHRHEDEKGAVVLAKATRYGLRASLRIWSWPAWSAAFYVERDGQHYEIAASAQETKYSIAISAGQE